MLKMWLNGKILMTNTNQDTGYNFIFVKQSTKGSICLLRDILIFFFLLISIFNTKYVLFV